MTKCRMMRKLPSRAYPPFRSRHGRAGRVRRVNDLINQGIEETYRIITRSAEIAGVDYLADYMRTLPEGDALSAWLRERRWLIPRNARYLEVKP